MFAAFDVFMTAASRPTIPVSAGIPGQGALTATARIYRAITAALPGHGVLSATAKISSSPALTGHGGLSAVAGLTIDASNVGNKQTTSGTDISTTWTHAIAANANLVVVAVFFATGNSVPTNFTRTVTVGGQTMTSAGNKVLSGVTTSNLGFCEFFYKLNPTTGSQTVSVECNGGSNDVIFITGSSVSFISATAVGAIQSSGTTSGSNCAETVTSATGHVIVQQFANTNTTTTDSLSAYNKTQIRNDATLSGTIAWGASGNKLGYIVGDAAGAASVSFSATVNTTGSNQRYCAAAVDVS